MDYSSSDFYNQLNTKKSTERSETEFQIGTDGMFITPPHNMLSVLHKTNLDTVPASGDLKSKSR